MFKILKFGIQKKGIVTTKYPFEPYQPFGNSKGMPIVDTNKCKHIGACAKACPTNAITLTEKHIMIDIGLCIFCGNCEQACPEEAIKLSHEIELSVREKDHLKVTF